MLDPTVIAKIKKLEIKTRRVMRGMLIGESQSAAKGFGFDFDQIRPYQPGDDIRFIDWKASTRKSTLLVKQYHQEQNKTILIAVDCSASQQYASTDTLKTDLAAQVGGVLALASQFHNDAVALLLFTDQVEFYIPPGKGTAHVHTILNTLFSYKPRSKRTNIGNALKYIGLLKRRDMLVFLISDFIDHTYEKSIAVVSKKHDLVALCCVDPCEVALPHIGFLTVVDQETGQEVLLDLRKTSGVNAYLERRRKEYKKVCSRYGISQLSIEPGSEFIPDLIFFFNKRVKGYASYHKKVQLR